MLRKCNLANYILRVRVNLDAMGMLSKLEEIYDPETFNEARSLLIEISGFKK